MRLPMRWLVVGTFGLAALGAVLGRGADPAPETAMGSGPSASIVQLAEPVTPASWATALLASLGDPASAANLQAVTAWERAEGGHWSNTAAHNPLNTTLREPGSWPINSVGVEAYPTWSEGLAATVATLTNGRYGGVLAALRAGDCASCVADAVGASPWGTGRFAV